jgi:hypothetical protein
MNTVAIILMRIKPLPRCRAAIASRICARCCGGNRPAPFAASDWRHCCAPS